jgi:formate-dependent nitrite reductase membrane component NrfD
LWAEGPAEILQQLAAPEQLPPSREVYNVAHGKPWGWHISAYLWTKSIAAGVVMVAASWLLNRWDRWPSLPAADVLVRAAPVLSLIFLGITCGLLVFDLKRPERFWRLLLTPNFRSWLVWGGYILGAFGAAMAAWWLWPQPPPALLALAGVLALSAAGYSAFLFGQAEGRDFWQSPLLLPHLLVQAGVAGAAVLLAWTQFTGREVPEGLENWLSGGLAAHLLMIFGELAMPHTNRDSAAAAAHIIGKRGSLFWGLVIAAGAVLPFLGITLIGEPAYGVASLAALAGLYGYEHLWVEAGQAAPLS